MSKTLLGISDPSCGNLKDTWTWTDSPKTRGRFPFASVSHWHMWTQHLHSDAERWSQTIHSYLVGFFFFFCNASATEPAAGANSLEMCRLVPKAVTSKWIVWCRTFYELLSLCSRVPMRTVFACGVQHLCPHFRVNSQTRFVVAVVWRCPTTQRVTGKHEEVT